MFTGACWSRVDDIILEEVCAELVLQYHVLEGMTVVSGDKSLICGCKTNLAFIEQIVREAYYFIISLGESDHYQGPRVISDAQNRNDFDLGSDQK